MTTPIGVVVTSVEEVISSPLKTEKKLWRRNKNLHSFKEEKKATPYFWVQVLVEEVEEKEMKEEEKKRKQEIQNRNHQIEKRKKKTTKKMLISGCH